MSFHMLCELPAPVTRELASGLPALTDEEIRILKAQIQKNSRVIAEDLKRLDLFLNKERYPSEVSFVQKIRNNLKLSMAENDTFRKVLWKHVQSLETVRKAPEMNHE